MDGWMGKGSQMSQKWTMSSVREKCRRGQEVVSALRSRQLNLGYSLTHYGLEALGAATAKLPSGWHFSCSP